MDAECAGELGNRFSTTGFVLFVYGGALAWSSKEQNCVATTTAVAEFMAASATVKEAAWLQSLLEELVLLEELGVCTSVCENPL